MEAIIHLILFHVFMAFDMLFHLPIFNSLDLLAPSSSDFSHVHGIGDNVGDCRIRPAEKASGRAGGFFLRYLRLLPNGLLQHGFSQNAVAPRGIVDQNISTSMIPTKF